MSFLRWLLSFLFPPSPPEEEGEVDFWEKGSMPDEKSAHGWKRKDEQ